MKKESSSPETQNASAGDQPTGAEPQSVTLSFLPNGTPKYGLSDVEIFGIFARQIKSPEAARLVHELLNASLKESQKHWGLRRLRNEIREAVMLVEITSSVKGPAAKAWAQDFLHIQ